MKLNRLIEISKALLDKNGPTRYNHFAFLIKGSTIKSIGWNKPGYTKLSRKYNYKDMSSQVHAELDAIRKLNKTNLKGYTIVIIRVSKTGKLGMSAPCSACRRVIEDYGISTIFYSTSDQQIIKGEKIETAFNCS